jgi:hypothetical protein
MMDSIRKVTKNTMFDQWLGAVKVRENGGRERLQVREPRGLNLSRVSGGLDLQGHRGHTMFDEWLGAVKVRERKRERGTKRRRERESCWAGRRPEASEGAGLVSRTQGHQGHTVSDEWLGAVKVRSLRNPLAMLPPEPAAATRMAPFLPSPPSAGWPRSQGLGLR